MCGKPRQLERKRREKIRFVQASTPPERPETEAALAAGFRACDSGDGLRDLGKAQGDRRFRRHVGDHLTVVCGGAYTRWLEGIQAIGSIWIAAANLSGLIS